jgi:hypothetical protein
VRIDAAARVHYDLMIARTLRDFRPRLVRGRHAFAITVLDTSAPVHGLSRR